MTSSLKYCLAVVRHGRLNGSDGLIYQAALSSGMRWVIFVIGDLAPNYVGSESVRVVRVRSAFAFGRITRLVSLYRAMRHLAGVSGHPSVVIASSAELARVCDFAFADIDKKFFLISDLSRFHMSPFFGVLASHIERGVVKSGWIPCVTSPGFFWSYLLRRKIASQALLVHNIDVIHEMSSPPSSMISSSGKVVVGWAGLLRCDTSLEILTHLTSSSPSSLFAVEMWGDVGELDSSLPMRSSRDDVMSFYGPYDSRDLASIYCNFSFTWACDWSSRRVRRVIDNASLLIPNRLYQGIKACRPIIASEGSLTGKLVVDLGIGFTISDDVAEAVAKIRSVKESEYCVWVSNMMSVRVHRTLVENAWLRIFAGDYSYIIPSSSPASAFLA